jgi:hypothetical protein
MFALFLVIEVLLGLVWQFILVVLKAFLAVHFNQVLVFDIRLWLSGHMHLKATEVENKIFNWLNISFVYFKT